MEELSKYNASAIQEQSKHDYSIYRYYKGEMENPFEKLLNGAEIDKSHLPLPECVTYEYNLPINEAKRLQNSKMFWLYESVFETLFNRESNAYWRNHFNFYAREKFCRVLTGKDNDNPTESKKAAVFDIWLSDYLFIDKLGIEYGGDNWYKEQYYSNSI
ncbi:MAG: hypothetical protein LBJ39_00330 [Tannerellaceae bacterium]|jgi:hypothetical protein|nr:hypothetical protein [Tannerellaceae bacterium]